MSSVLVIGASGDVGRGITVALLSAGHAVIGAGRNAHRLQALADELGRPPGLHCVAGSVEGDVAAQALQREVAQFAKPLHGVVVSVNAPREQTALLAQSAEVFAARIHADLLTHYCAARAFLPVLAPGGVFLGIGGGSADFVLEGGVHMSVAQAGLRMLYRGLAHETSDLGVHVRELVIASVVNGASTRASADPSWVTAEEIGEQVVAMLRLPTEFMQPVWRISRRDATGRPVLSAEPATRVQGLRQPKEATQGLP